MSRRKLPAWARRKRRIAKRNPTDRNYGSPDKLGQRERGLWDRFYETGMKLYGDQEYAEGLGWRAVRFVRGEDIVDQGLVKGRISNPEDTIILGKFIELHYLVDRRSPRLESLKFNPQRAPDLLWSRKHKMLCVFPRVEIPEFRGEIPPDKKHLKSEFKTWSQRNPRGAATVKVPAPRLSFVGCPDTVVYRSSKWTDVPGDPPGSQEYIHQFGERVVLGWGPEPGQIVDGTALAIRGGKLDVIAAGIIN